MQPSQTSQFEIILLHDDAKPPQRAHADDAGLDLFAYGSHALGPSQTMAVPTGIKVQIPARWMGLVLPRSGRSMDRPFIQPNSPGLLDPGYQGELRVPQRCISPGVAGIDHHEKIAQLIFLPCAYLEPKQVQSFIQETARGESGLGSTGK